MNLRDSVPSVPVHCRNLPSTKSSDSEDQAVTNIFLMQDQVVKSFCFERTRKQGVVGLGEPYRINLLFYENKAVTNCYSRKTGQQQTVFIGGPGISKLCSGTRQ
jgi:hypothetical protein